jgi:class 3 adenylate cyclase
MEPRIQYAKTKDGVSIAFYTLGKGMPVILMPWIPWSHLEREWQMPELRRMVEAYSQKGMVIRYDHRGSGLSERDVTDRSLGAYLLDLEAIIGQLGLETFALVARASSAPVAIAFTARNPERVSRLVLDPMSYARASDFFTPQVQRILALMEVDWELFTETIVRWALRWSEGGAERRGAAYLRECVTQQEAQAANQALQEVDVSDHLSQVRAPTLVVHNRRLQLSDLTVAKGLATNISNARLVIVEETEQVATAIDEFLGEGEKAETASEELSADIVHTILFTDVEGSTALTDRLGDAKARDLLREHERMIREALKAHGGSEVKALGDGFMTSFSSASKALECAIAMQRAFAERNESAEEPIKVRIGLNAGEPIAEDEDLFGTAVILAARIAAQAEGGEILASEAVRQIVAGKKFPFSDRGETALRGFEDRVHIYQVSWRGED